VVAALVATVTLTAFSQNSTRSSNQIDQVLREAVSQKNFPALWRWGGGHPCEIPVSAD
jgi:hypothetical protein